MPNVGLPELLIIFLILLLLFGANRLTGIGQAIGRTIREFRKEVRDVEEDVRDERRPKASSYPRLLHRAMAADRPMTIIEHLEELRRRLLIAIAALLVATAISWFFADQLLTFFIRPVTAASGRGVIFIGVSVGVFLRLQLRVLAGVLFPPFAFVSPPAGHGRKR